MTSSTPPLKCECPESIAEEHEIFDGFCVNCGLPFPTVETITSAVSEIEQSQQKKDVDRLRNMQLDNLELSSKISLHTPPVEGEWEKGEKAKDELEVLLSAEREEARAEERERIVKMCEEMIDEKVMNAEGLMDDETRAIKIRSIVLSSLRDKLTK